MLGIFEMFLTEEAVGYLNQVCKGREKRRLRTRRNRKQVGNLSQVLMASGLAHGEILRHDQEVEHRYKLGF